MTKTFTIKNRIRETLLFRNRLIVASILMGLLCLLLIAQFFHLQVFRYQHYVTLSIKNQIDLDPLAPRRGLIFDRHGALLVENMPAFNLMLTPSKVKNISATLKKLNKIIPLNKNDLALFKKQLKQRRRFEQIPLKLKLTEQEIAKFEVNRYQFPGISIKTQLIRHYPFKNIFAPALGYMGRINEQELAQVDASNYAATNFIGKMGIEKYYESQLHGTVGYKKIETDANGQVVRTLSRLPAVSGGNIYLTLDSQLQLAAVKALGNQHGAVIAIEPDTGAIVALVSNPSYDPNLFVMGISQKAYQQLQQDKAHPLYNRAIRGLYAPGSVIKPFIALGGLSAGVTTRQFEIYDPGWYQLPNTKHVFHDWKKGGHGWINLAGAIIESCDTYFYDLANKMGIARIDDILMQFGFDKPTGIDIPEELSGNIPTPEWKFKARGIPWYTGDTILSGIGQGFMQVTPIQLAEATATLANRGRRIQPHLLYAIKQANGEILYQKPLEEPPVILKNAHDWDIVLNAMKKVISQGTGYRFGHAPYSVAAKTGTAQVLSSHYARDIFDNGKNIPIQLRNNSMFIAFAPFKHPKIAVAVVVDNSPIAPVVARKVMDYYLLQEKHLMDSQEKTGATDTVKTP